GPTGHRLGRILLWRQFPAGVKHLVVGPGVEGVQRGEVIVHRLTPPLQTTRRPHSAARRPRSPSRAAGETLYSENLSCGPGRQQRLVRRALRESTRSGNPLAIQHCQTIRGLFPYVPRARNPSQTTSTISFSSRTPRGALTCTRRSAQSCARLMRSRAVTTAD